MQELKGKDTLIDVADVIAKELKECYRADIRSNDLLSDCILDSDTYRDFMDYLIVRVGYLLCGINKVPKENK